jgi:hypothetical protein
MRFFIEGDSKFPTINGTGTEDYFGASYGFPENCTTAYAGNTLNHAGKDGPLGWWQPANTSRCQMTLPGGVLGSNGTTRAISQVSGVVREVATVVGCILPSVETRMQLRGSCETL